MLPAQPFFSTLLAEHSHLANMANCEFVFLFIEEKRQRFEMLQATLAERDDPPNVRVTVRCGTFEDHITEVLDGLGKKRLAPAFVMVDPFGVKGLPLDVLRRLAAFPTTELLISFMYEPISRFLSQREFEAHLDSLFGTSEWRGAMGLPSDVKKAFLSGLYASQLRKIGMRHVRLFEMRDAGNRTEYFLAYATQSHHGLRVIKDAMWKVDGAGGVAFSDFTAPGSDQGTLFGAEPDLPELRALVMGHFRGRGRVHINEVKEFVLTDTAFRETHGLTVLRQAEKSDAIAVTRPAGRTKAYWNKGTFVTFLPPE